MLNIITATREKEEDFYTKTSLGRSLIAMQSICKDWNLYLYYDNKEGLSKVYNCAIDTIDKSIPSIFVHDDVSLQDVFLEQKLKEAFLHYSIVGVAGGCLLPRSKSNLAECKMIGAIGEHRNNSELVVVKFYESTETECNVIDGLFIAVDSNIFNNFNIRFDERFTFNHYDIDFCRQAEVLNLKIGVCAIWVTHSCYSGDVKNDPQYLESETTYRKKYTKEKINSDEEIINFYKSIFWSDK